MAAEAISGSTAGASAFAAGSRGRRGLGSGVFLGLDRIFTKQRKTWFGFKGVSGLRFRGSRPRRGLGLRVFWGLDRI